jgi:predicted HNH restriction endonuclease
VTAVDAGWPKPGYFCTAWHIDGREGRELFLEIPGSSDRPDVLRVGLYFLDSAAVSRVRTYRALVTEQLLKNRRRLRRLGLVLTSSRRKWDEAAFGWTEAEIVQWMKQPSHKDLVWRWDLRKGFPAPEKAVEVLSALAPMWRLINGLGRRSTVAAVDEGARREISRELALRDGAFVEAAREHYKAVCRVCGFRFGEVYGERGEGFIEVHHLKPIARGRRRTRLEDVTVVCSNCHRMLHRGIKMWTVKRLKKEVLANRAMKRKG